MGNCSSDREAGDAIMGRTESLQISTTVPESLVVLTIVVYESSETISKTDARVIRRLKFILYRYRGASVAEASDLAGVSRKTGYNIQKAWNEGGMDSIIPHFSTGPAPRLSAEDMLEIQQYLEANPMDATSARAYIREHYGEDFSEKHIRNMFMGRGLKYSKDLRRGPFSFSSSRNSRTASW